MSHFEAKRPPINKLDQGVGAHSQQGSQTATNPNPPPPPTNGRKEKKTLHLLAPRLGS